MRTLTILMLAVAGFSLGGAAADWLRTPFTHRAASPASGSAALLRLNRPPAPDWGAPPIDALPAPRIAPPPREDVLP